MGTKEQHSEETEMQQRANIWGDLGLFVAEKAIPVETLPHYTNPQPYCVIMI